MKPKAKANTAANISNPNDDDFDELTGAGDLHQFDDYKKFEVDTKGEMIKQSVKKLIVSLAKVYLDEDKITNEDYVKALASLEEQNLLVMCKQVYYAEHVVDTLIRRLDGGGFVDPDLYDQIRKMQASVIQITLEVSRYTRNLPEYFRFVNTEVGKINAVDMLSKATSGFGNETLGLVESTEQTFSILKPVRGTRELMLDISDSLSDIDMKLKESTEIEATPIVIDDDDDDDYTETLTEFEDDDDE